MLVVVLLENDLKSEQGLIMQICQHLPQRTKESHTTCQFRQYRESTHTHKCKLQAHQFVGHTLNPQLLKYEAGVLPTQVIQLNVKNMYYLISCRILIHEKNQSSCNTEHQKGCGKSSPVSDANKSVTMCAQHPNPFRQLKQAGQTHKIAT